jgi:hypothetical protein
MLVSGIKERDFMLGKEPKKVYGLMLKMTLHAIKQADLSEVEGNPLLTALTDNVRILVIGINSLLRRRVAESSIYLKNAVDFLENLKNSREPLYIILCDALSIPEYLFLLYIFQEFVNVGDALCAVNPSGKTMTFKYLAKEYLDITVPASLEETTLKSIGEGLRKKLGASGFSILRDIDMLIHYSGEYSHVDDMINSLSKIAEKIRREVQERFDNGYEVLLLADHGYDVLKRENMWTLTHRWDVEKPCMSPFVPILIMGVK